MGALIRPQQQRGGDSPGEGTLPSAENWEENGSPAWHSDGDLALGRHNVTTTSRASLESTPEQVWWPKRVQPRRAPNVATSQGQQQLPPPHLQSMSICSSWCSFEQCQRLSYCSLISPHLSPLLASSIATPRLASHSHFRQFDAAHLSPFARPKRLLSPRDALAGARTQAHKPHARTACTETVTPDLKPRRAIQHQCRAAGTATPETRALELDTTFVQTIIVRTDERYRHAFIVFKSPPHSFPLHLWPPSHILATLPHQPPTLTPR